MQMHIERPLSVTIHFNKVTVYMRMHMYQLSTTTSGSDDDVDNRQQQRQIQQRRTSEELVNSNDFQVSICRTREFI